MSGESSEDGALSDRDFILQERKWPLWPVLPVKRRVMGEISPQCAVLLARGDGRSASEPAKSFIVCLVSLLELKGQLERSEKVLYATVEELLADGWIID